MHFATEVSSGRSFFEEKLVELRDFVLSDGITFEGEQINDLSELDLFLSNNLSAFKGSIYEELKRDVIHTEHFISLSMPDNGVTFFIENASIDEKLEMLNWYCKPNVSSQEAITTVECKNMPFKEASLDITFQWEKDNIKRIEISFSNKEGAEKHFRTIASDIASIYDSWLSRQIGAQRYFDWGSIVTTTDGINIEIKKEHNTVYSK